MKPGGFSVHGESLYGKAIQSVEIQSRLRRSIEKKGGVLAIEFGGFCIRYTGFKQRIRSIGRRHRQQVYRRGNKLISSHLLRTCLCGCQEQVVLDDNCVGFTKFVIIQSYMIELYDSIYLDFRSFVHRYKGHYMDIAQRSIESIS